MELFEKFMHITRKETNTTHNLQLFLERSKSISFFTISLSSHSPKNDK